MPKLSRGELESIKAQKDMCSLSPEGDWAGSCRDHDIAYATIYYMRLDADQKLREGVEKGTNGNMKWYMKLAILIFGRKTVANVYFWGVRIGGKFTV